jgi:hypothetical protein
MQLDDKKAIKILKKYKNLFEELEHYDRTREKLWAKKRMDITLTLRLIKKLENIRDKTKKPISHLIEEMIKRNH